MAQEGNFYPKAAELGTAGRAVGPSMDDTESQSRDKVTQRETHGRDTKTQNGSPKLPNPQLGENAESGVCPRQGKVRSEVEAGKCPWWAEPILVGGVCLWRGPSRVCPWWGGVRTVGAVPVCSGQGPRTCAARPAAPNCSPGIIAEVHYERRAHLLPEDLRDPALRTGTKRAGREPGSDPRNAKTAPRVPGDTLRTSVSSSRRLRQDPSPLVWELLAQRPLHLTRIGGAGATLEPAHIQPRAVRYLLLLRAHHAAAAAPGGSVYFLPVADPPDQTGSTTSPSSPGRGVPGNTSLEAGRGRPALWRRDRLGCLARDGVR